MSANNQIFITSVNKAINRAKLTGNFNLTILSLVEMIIDLIDYTDALIVAKPEDTKIQADNKELKLLLAQLRYKFPSIICNYKQVVPKDNTEDPTGTNTAPTVTGNNYDLLSSTLYQFKVGDFTSGFVDADGDSWSKLLIKNPTALTSGFVYTLVGGTPVPLTSDLEITINGLAPTTLLNLYYERTNTDAFATLDAVTFRVSDNAVNFLYSNLANFNFTASVAAVGAENQPPDDIGDNTLYLDNRATTTLTLFMFTGGLQPPYNDPEGDLIDAIRIVDISNANRGQYLVSGTPVVVGQIITREEINAGLFVHVAPDQDADSSDVFEFEARDEGSQIWVG